MCGYTHVCVFGVHDLEYSRVTTPTYPHVVRAIMEGILETLDSWRSLTHHSPVEGSQVSDHPDGGVLGKGRGRRKGGGGRGGREEERKGGVNRICKEVMYRHYHGESSV